MKQLKKTKKNKRGGASLSYNNINSFLLNKNVTSNADLTILLQIINDFKSKPRLIKLDKLSTKISKGMFNIITNLGIIKDNKLSLIEEKVLEIDLKIQLKLSLIKEKELIKEKALKLNSEIELNLTRFINPLKTPIREKIMYYDNISKITQLFSHYYIVKKYKFPILKTLMIMSTYTDERIKEYAEYIVPYIKCYDVIISPLSLYIDEEHNIESHFVSLIFRKSNSTFEYYDPHGQSDTYSYIHLYIKELIKLLKDQYGIIIEYSEDNQIKRGFQVLQQIQQHRQELNYRYEPEGFCYMWNIFFWELIIQNPTLNNIEIITRVISDFMRDLNTIICNYILYMQEELKKYLVGNYGITFEKLFLTNVQREIKDNIVIFGQIRKDLDTELRIPFTLCG
jgi:hypothetical protein